ncbi:MAG: hypothetical protein AAGC64_07095 [Bacteroidota bacterium]
MMKNEERIIELLSEYLHKSDKHEEETNRLYKEFNKILKRVDETINQVDKNGERIDKNLEELIAMRSQSLKNDVRHDVVLKEILSLSRE